MSVNQEILKYLNINAKIKLYQSGMLGYPYDRTKYEPFQYKIYRLCNTFIFPNEQSKKYFIQILETKYNQSYIFPSGYVFNYTFPTFGIYYVTGYKCINSDIWYYKFKITNYDYVPTIPIYPDLTINNFTDVITNINEVKDKIIFIQKSHTNFNILQMIAAIIKKNIHDKYYYHVFSIIRDNTILCFLQNIFILIETTCILHRNKYKGENNIFINKKQTDESMHYRNGLVGELSDSIISNHQRLGGFTSFPHNYHVQYKSSSPRQPAPTLSRTIGISVDICPQISPCSLTFRSATGGSERRANNSMNENLYTIIKVTIKNEHPIDICYLKIGTLYKTIFTTDFHNELLYEKNCHHPDYVPSILLAPVIKKWSYIFQTPSFERYIAGLYDNENNMIMMKYHIIYH